LGRCQKLLLKARGNPGGLLFTELQALAECFGFEHVRTRGSHHLFKRPGHVALLNFQSRRGEARAYQVRQLLDAIDAIAREDENHECP
jgi:hypothetical protein